ADMFVLTQSPQEAPNTPQYIEIDFAAGDPVAVDGQKMSPFQIIDHLNKVGGKHGIGR
ncbi:MAG TPA: argininosuccinate synthase, partial [Desulfobacterales bacterium]|nr:argininosuccinate synthase [Desulfobacterales bacterium]